MEERIRMQISTGPLEEDWLVGEILFGEEQFVDLVEWGEKIIFFIQVKMASIGNYPLTNFLRR
jgi:hypothetical protein